MTLPRISLCDEVGGLVDCPCCDGSGVELEHVTVYERGCCAPHDDAIEYTCGECGGAGEVWEECETAGEEWTL